MQLLMQNPLPLELIRPVDAENTAKEADEATPENHLLYIGRILMPLGQTLPTHQVLPDTV